MPAALLAALALQAAPLPTPSPAEPPSAETISLAERLSRVGLLAALAAPVTGAEVLDVIASHPELTGEQRGRAAEVAYAARSEALRGLLSSETPVLARHLTAQQLREIGAFFESPAGLAYRALFPLLLLNATQTGPAKDFRAYVTKRVCDEAQACPAAK